MALVGEMQYLTIGNDTYSLPTGGGGGGSVTSVAVSNATNGGLSVSGSPITSSGTISIGHSNVLTSAQSTSAVYPITIDKNGHIASYGSAVTIPTITLNGSSTTTPSFYAATGAGTSGQYLKSSGSGAPTWETFPTIPSITLNGSATTSPSFYAPTSAGTSGYVLISSGSGAPNWTSATLTDTKVTQTANSTESTNRMLLMSDYAPSNNTTHDGGAKTSSYLYFQPSTGKLAAGYNTNNRVEIQPTLMKFHYSDNGANYVLSLQIPDLSVVSNPAPTITLPNTTGTIALTSDIPTVPTNVSAFTNDAGYTTNTGTVTSVQVQATSPVNSSSSSASSTTLSTTISLSDAYGDTKNPYGTKTANYVLAGPTSGSAAAPSFRALVAADIPDLSGTYALTSDIPTVPTNVSAFNNDAGYLTAHQTIPVTDVKMNNASIVTSGVANITDSSGNMSINGTLTTGGSIIIPNLSGLYIKNTANPAVSRSVIKYNANNNLLIGSADQIDDHSSTGGWTAVYGYGIELWTGSTSSDVTLKFRVNPSGRTDLYLATTDALYTAISTAGWTSSVIVS